MISPDQVECSFQGCLLVPDETHDIIRKVCTLVKRILINLLHGSLAFFAGHEERLGILSAEVNLKLLPKLVKFTRVSGAANRYPSQMQYFRVQLIDIRPALHGQFVEDIADARIHAFLCMCPFLVSGDPVYINPDEIVQQVDNLLTFFHKNLIRLFAEIIMPIFLMKRTSAAGQLFTQESGYFCLSFYERLIQFLDLHSLDTQYFQGPFIISLQGSVTYKRYRRRSPCQILTLGADQ
jgi:hypothetical protein